MPRIDLIEPYAVRFARQSIRDSLMSHGEEVVLLRTYHVNEDQGIQPRCPVCWDDVYEQNETFDCDHCYGTSFDGGIKQVWRAWAIFTDAKDAENITTRGVWHPKECGIHTEHLPDLWQRDFVVRVHSWTQGHQAGEVEGVYVCKEVQNESLRTGNRIGQTPFDIVGQRVELQRLADEMPIYRYQITGKVFPRFDGKVR